MTERLEETSPLNITGELTEPHIDDASDRADETWNAPFAIKREGPDAWEEDVPTGSFSLNGGTFSWSADVTKGPGDEIVLGTEEDSKEFFSWFTTQPEKSQDELFTEKVVIESMTSPRVQEIRHWHEDDHPMEEWTEMVRCTFDDLAPLETLEEGEKLAAEEERLLASGDELPEAFVLKKEACIKKLRDFYVGRIDEEKVFFKGKFKRDCDFISPQAEEFRGEQFRVRISKGGQAIATHVTDEQDIRIKFRHAKQNAKEDKQTLLTAKIRNRIKESKSKEELQSLLDFVRTVQDDTKYKTEEDKEVFKARRDSWILEIEELLRNGDLPNEVEEVEVKKRVFKANYLPQVKISGWCNPKPKNDKEKTKAAMLQENALAIEAHEEAQKGKKKKKKCELKKDQLTKEQEFLLQATPLDLKTRKAVQMTEEERKEDEEGEDLSFHRIHNLVDAAIPARLVVKAIVNEVAPNRKWKSSNIKVTLPVSLGLSGDVPGEEQDLAVCEIGKISVYDANRLHRYNHGKGSLRCKEMYTFDKSVKLVQCQITKTHIGFLALCSDSKYQTVFVLDRKTNNIYGFGTKTCPITSFALDEEDSEHVWLGFNSGLLTKMEIKTRKRRKDFWIAEEAPVQIIKMRRNRIIVSTHKGLVLFNNGPGYENKDKRVIMPIGPTLDIAFYGNLLIAHRPDNGLQLLNMLTFDLEAIIPPPQNFETGTAHSPYNSITLTNDHVTICLPGGNVIHFHA